MTDSWGLLTKMVIAGVLAVIAYILWGIVLELRMIAFQIDGLQLGGDEVDWLRTIKELPLMEQYRIQEHYRELLCSP